MRYHASSLSREPDTFVLYRIIGNDLPPRHHEGQSRQNLAFILEHEPALPGCEKRFIVNRIADPDEEQTVLAMLDAAGAHYLHLPFVREAYRKAQWEIEGLPVAYAPWTARFSQLTEAEQGRALMRLYRHKNNAVMNNNGARNAALHDGRRIAKWVLPWDGNCFVTAAAWDDLVATVRVRPERPYFVVPMARITENSLLLDPGYRPESDQEPQLVFRRDTPLEFDSDYCYGRRPKVELLWRLGVPGDWDDWSLEPWDLPCPAYADEAGAFATAGWVARLSSGNVHLEQAEDDTLVAGRYDTAFVERGLARVSAIREFIDTLDERVQDISAVATDSVFVSLAESNGPTDSAKGMVSASLMRSLRTAADRAMGRGPYSVVHKTSLPPSGDPHDYWHPAPYYWPHPSKLPWLPYVRRDGKRVPGTQLYEPLSKRYDRTRLQRLLDDTFVLALAARELADSRYAEHAAMLVRVWFLEPDTAMNPHLDYAQVRRGHNDNRGSNSGLIEFKDLYYFLDAVRLLRRGIVLSAAELSALEEWFGRYLHWLKTSPQGRRERTEPNNHGTYYDLQVASVAAFLGEARTVRETLRDSRSRIIQQFDERGIQPEELARTNTAHYCCFNMQGWIHLAQLAERCGEDLWSFEGRDGRGIKRSMQWLMSHAGRAWPYPQTDEFDAERFYPLHHAAASRLGNDVIGQGETVPAAEAIKPVFFPHDGIMPFWQFGAWHGSSVRESVGRGFAPVANTGEGRTPK